MNKLLRMLRASCLMPAAALAGCAASPYWVDTASPAFLPEHGAPTSPGERKLLPDQLLFETPIGFSAAVEIAAPVDAQLLGKRYALPPKAQLAVARVSGEAAIALPRGARSACGNVNASLLKSTAALSTLGLSTLLSKTALQSRLCLVDEENDGLFDKAFVAGVRSMKDAAPVAITPVPYRNLFGEPMPGTSVARITYRGKTGLVGGHVSFDLTIIEAGQPLMFDNVRTQVSIKTLPQTVSLMGTSFTVKSYDPTDGHVMVDVHRGFLKGEYGITTTTSTTYIPIYVGR